MRFSFVIFLLLCAAQTFARAQPDVFTISIINNTPDQLATTSILSAIYKEAGLDVQFIPFPGKRALIESSSGRVDGEAQRIFEIGEAYPSLVRIPTPFITWQFTAFSKHPQKRYDSWQSLKGQRVAVVRGIKYAELGLRSAKIRQIMQVGDIIEMLKMLDAGFVDVAISSKFNGMLQTRRGNHSDIHVHLPAIGDLQLYHYLHEKHADVVPLLDAAVSKLKRNGRIRVMQQELVATMLEQGSRIGMTRANQMASPLHF